MENEQDFNIYDLEGERVYEDVVGQESLGTISIRQPIRVRLAEGFVFGQDGNPTQAQYEAELRDSLGESMNAGSIIIYSQKGNSNPGQAKSSLLERFVDVTTPGMPTPEDPLWHYVMNSDGPLDEASIDNYLRNERGKE